MVEYNMLFLNLEVEMGYSLSFSHNFDNKKLFRPHKPDHIWTSPSTIFSDGMCRIKAQSSENCLKMLSDQNDKKIQVTIG